MRISRKNKLSDQTLVFNLSESFVDPKEFPSVKISNDVRDPIKYIRKLHFLYIHLKNNSHHMEYGFALKLN